MNNRNDSRAFGYCPVHDKLLFLSRKKAREAARKQHRTVHKNAYRCSEQSELWHFGTVAPAVFSGKMTRLELYG